ncbi:zinc finger protein 142-like [Zophobas morio]|uniref:zinc finger protein 142-like n=1 Tax=Zophobas morio TaxID=2755281 RepID=UPI0030835613
MSQRQIARQMETSLERDLIRRLVFCEFVKAQLRDNQDFLFNDLFTDEATITNNGCVTRHNSHYYVQQNPHWNQEKRFQEVFSVNAWYGIVNHVIERRSATVTDDDSPIIAAQTRKISTAHRRQTSTVALLYFIRHWSSSHFNGETHDVKSYYCQDCNYRTVLTLLFKQHLQDRHGIKKEQEQYYTWKKCPFKTKPNYHLKSHINGRHSDGQDIKRVTCQECPFKTKYNHSLKMHIHVKHLLLVDKEIKWYYCEKCSYKGKFSWELKKHINALHLEEDDIKWYECKECQFKTKHKPYLNIHINPRHLNGADIK